MNTFLGKIKSILSFLKAQGVVAGVIAVAMAFGVYQISVQTNAVYIRDGEQVSLKLTTEESPRDILNQHGITTMAFDAVDFSGFSGKIGHINIKRAFSVYVNVEGVTYSTMVTEGTVEDAIRRADVTLNPLDEVNLSLNKILVPDDYIEIKRISYETVTETEEIPFEVEEKDSSVLIQGRSYVLQQGINGKKQVESKIKLVDGVEVKRETLEETIIAEPVAKQIVNGKRGAPISDLDFGYTLDANGVPTKYKSVLTNQIATGYSASKTARGASGMRLFYGYVATRADQIPYGTKMYITSPDNNFVYGYAIAADTGIGLMDDVIDVDLYYETYAESCMNGRKYVNIYILE